MHEHVREIRQLLDSVRSRWKRLALFQATIRAALAVAGVLAMSLALTHWTSRSPAALAGLGIMALLLATGAAVWGLWPVRETPSDRRIARFVEENEPSLDDRLVSAVDLMAFDGDRRSAPLAEPMLADAARSAARVDPAAIVPVDRLRRAGYQAGAAVLLLMAVGFAGRHSALQSLDALALTLFPSRVALEVSPGTVRIEAGSPLTIEARLVGNDAPVVAKVVHSEGEEDWRETEMAAAGASQAFRLGVDAVHTSFKYRVVAAGVTSPTYEVTVARAPRVTRIDVDYRYPAELGLPPRTEEDSGDIYAPSGTDARIRIHTDMAVGSGQMTLADGHAIGLSIDSDKVLTGTLKVIEDNSYRVALADREGLKNPGDTEYFIRILADRPPDVHILKPARDRSVTRLEEVGIEAHAEDDYGVDRLELVYGVRGGTEKTVPLAIPAHATSVTAVYTLALEDLDVQPGDFVSYYVRARDLARGKRSNEARSDIFFLDVKPFEQEFVLAKNQNASAGGSSVDDLVSAQKEIIVATWKLDRRAQAADGAKSEQDIHSVERAEADLKTRVEQTSSTFRESTMRDPRRPGRGNAPKAGESLPEEDAMGAAAAAMGKAVGALGALKTVAALPPEMEALDHLLKAQDNVKRREISNQQAGAATGANRSNVDMSNLFDKELQRQQQTNYETTSNNEQPNQNESTLDKIHNLAARQDELNKQQEELARRQARMTADELKRELEKLTREQSELRQRAEELSRQMNQQPQNAQGQQEGKNQAGQGKASGQQGASGQQNGSAQRGSGRSGEQMRDVSEEMRNATSDLRRQDPSEASQRGARALEKLQALERQLQSGGPDEQRRALGDLQLETRQLADAERHAASELGNIGQGDAAKDALRRLAGEQERLADRAERVQESLKQASSGAPTAGNVEDKQGDSDRQRAAGEAANDLEQQRLPDRMHEAAADLRAASGQTGSAKGDTTNPKGQAAKAAATAQEIARELDRVADSLANAGAPQDDAARKLADQRERAEQLRGQMDKLTGQVEKLGQQGSQSNANASEKSGGDSGKAGRGQSGGGEGGTDLAQLREQFLRQLQQTQDLMKELQRDDPSFAQAGAGFTFEGSGMTLSSPGTEAFKQDFARWQQLRQQATAALERAETTLLKKLQEKETRDRLAAGADDKPPAGYETQVDSYFKALAGKKK